jgi:hypothetical protein
LQAISALGIAGKWGRSAHLSCGVAPNTGFSLFVYSSTSDPIAILSIGINYFAARIVCFHSKSAEGKTK